MRLGGMAIQYSVLNAEVLRAAQRSPEQYPNLQVRLCGWNVLFSSLSKNEQDEYILQSESQV
jgi:formate C-acetyltransferase